VWIIILSALGILFFNRSLNKFRASTSLRFFSSFFLTWGAWHNWMSDRIWNVHFYWCLSLISLSLVLRVVHAAARETTVSVWDFFWLGIVSSFILQIHIGGGLAIAACFFMLWKYARPQLNFRTLSIFCFAGLLMYLPYFYQEYHSHFLNTMGLHSARTFHGWNRQAVVKSFFSPWIYLSHFKDAYQMFGVFKEDSWGIPAFIGSILSILVGVLGLRSKHIFRSLFVFSWAIAPIYFFLNQRPFHDHYLASLMPYYLLGLALGTEYLYRQGAWKKTLALVHCGGFILCASIQSFGNYILHPDHPTVGEQVALAQEVSDRASRGNSVRATVVIGEIDKRIEDQIFVDWVLQKDLFGKEPVFRYSSYPKPCTMEIGRPRVVNGTAPIPIGPIAYLDCQ